MVILLPLNIIVEECFEIMIKNLMNISEIINPLSCNPTKWSNTLKQFVGQQLTNCLSVVDHSVGLALKGLNSQLLYNYSFTINA